MVHCTQSHDTSQQLDGCIFPAAAVKVGVVWKHKAQNLGWSSSHFIPLSVALIDYRLRQ